MLPRIFAAAACVLASCVIQAQYASLTGRVDDPSGAAVPGARVSASNTRTGVHRKAITDGFGTYRILLLQPGLYHVTVTASGFRPALSENVELEPDRTTTLVFSVEIGRASESIEVRAEPALTDTQNAGIGATVDRDRVRGLPLNGRNPLELMRLSPGVTLLSSAFLDVRNFNVASVNVNGGQGGASATLLDGASITLAERNEPVLAPGADLVGEFRVLTSGLPADFGWTSGGVTSMISRSGTPSLHGSAWEFLRNEAADANGWTNNRVGLQRPPLRYNQFGASTGGPLDLTRKQHRAFFFGTAESYRYRSTSTSGVRVPTQREIAGDFSSTLIRDAATGGLAAVRLYDPASTTANAFGPGFVRAPFPSTVIPASRIDPSALRVLAHVPSANRAGDDLTARNNYVRSAGTYVNNLQASVRGDAYTPAGTLVFGRVVLNRTDNSANPPVFGLENPAEPVSSTQQRNSANVLLGSTAAISQDLLLDSRLSVSRQFLLSRTPGTDGDYAAELLLPQLPPYLFPAFHIADIQTIGNNYYQFARRGWTVWQGSQSAIWSRGKHNLRVGADVRVYLRNHFQPGPASGEFSFTRAGTGDPQSPSGTGFGLATFLLGAVDSGQVAIGIARAERIVYVAGYLQNDWNVSRRLTMNFGLRYDYATPPAERYDRYSNFEAGRLVFADPSRRSIVRPDRNNFGPRVGFALNVSGRERVMLRGSYGVLFYHGGSLELPNTEGFSTATSYQSIDGARPAFMLRDGIPFLREPPGRFAGREYSKGIGVTFLDPESATPYVQQWSFGVQAAGGRQWLLEAHWVGNHAVKQYGYGYDLNALPVEAYAIGLALEDRVRNPYQDAIPPGTPLSGATLSRLQALRPVPDMLAITAFNPRMGNSVYHSLQLAAHRRMAAGVSVQAGFTIGKLIGDAGRNIVDFTTDGGSQQTSVNCGPVAAYDRRLCRSIEPQDISKQFVGSWVWQPSFAAGWEISGILTARSGFPLIVRGAQNKLSDRPDVLGSARLPESERTLERWFNTSMFVAPALYTFGSTPRTLPDVRGPGAWTLDASISRRLRFGERWSVVFRAEAFNMLNHVNYALPNTSFLTGGFGAITSAAPGRVMQTGVRIDF